MEFLTNDEHFPATLEQLQTSLEFELTGISNGILNKGD